VGDVVAGVAGLDPVGDRHGPVGGHGQDPQQLLEVGPVVLGVAKGDRRGGLAAPPPPIGGRVDAGELDRGGVVVQPRDVDAEAVHRVQHQPGRQAGPVGVEQPRQHPPDPVVVEQPHLALVQAEQGRVERCRPLLQRIHGLAVEYQVAHHHHPDGRGRRQLQPRVLVRHEAFQQPLQAQPVQEVVDDRQRPQHPGVQLERALVHPGLLRAHPCHRCPSTYTLKDEKARNPTVKADRTDGHD
jgi:hypothetical protein